MLISYYHKMDRAVTEKIPEIPITQIQATHLVKQLGIVFNVHDINVTFVDELKVRDSALKCVCDRLYLHNFYIKYRLWKDKLPIIGGSTYPKLRLIILYHYGQNVATLLHEFSHLLPGGDSHSVVWENHYEAVVNCYLSLNPNDVSKSLERVKNHPPNFLGSSDSVGNPNN